jgi:transposase
MSHRFRFLVGIDWATQAHQVCVLDADGRLLAERPVSHSGQALTEFADWLLALVGGEPALAAVAIEVPCGAVVDLLVERGFPVYALNPKQLDRFRDRHTVAGAKDDRRDALVLADSLRTDLKSFPSPNMCGDGSMTRGGLGGSLDGSQAESTMPARCGG